jgi:hypothetical protein
MVSSGMLRCMALVRTTWRNIPEEAILYSNRRENLKSSIALYLVTRCLTTTLF